MKCELAVRGLEKSACMLQTVKSWSSLQESCGPGERFTSIPSCEGMGLVRHKSVFGRRGFFRVRRLGALSEPQQVAAPWGVITTPRFKKNPKKPELKNQTWRIPRRKRTAAVTSSSGWKKRPSDRSSVSPELTTSSSSHLSDGDGVTCNATRFIFSSSSSSRSSVNSLLQRNTHTHTHVTLQQIHVYATALRWTPLKRLTAWKYGEWAPFYFYINARMLDCSALGSFSVSLQLLGL